MVRGTLTRESAHNLTQADRPLCPVPTDQLDLLLPAELERAAHADKAGGVHALPFQHHEPPSAGNAETAHLARQQRSSRRLAALLSFGAVGCRP